MNGDQMPFIGADAPQACARSSPPCASWIYKLHKKGCIATHEEIPTLDLNRLKLLFAGGSAYHA